MSTIVALALALEAAPPADAQPRPVIPYGYNDCGVWQTERSIAKRRFENGKPVADVTRMEQWVWGYVGAFRRYGHPKREIPVFSSPNSDDTIWKRLDAYCAANPRVTVAEAVGVLVESFTRRRSRKR